MAIIHSGESPPDFSWANAVVVVQVHGRNDQLEERTADFDAIRKRRRPPAASDSSHSKRRRTTPSPFESRPRSTSFVRLSNPQNPWARVPSMDDETSAGGPKDEQVSNEWRNSGEGKEVEGEEFDESGNEAKHKNRSKDPDGSDESQYSIPSRPRLDSILKVWASEALHATANRRHLLGLHVSGLNMRFYIYDRAGIIYTQPLRIDHPDDALLFISAVLSLSMISPFNLGLEPFFAPTPRTRYYDAIRPSKSSSSQLSSVAWTDLEKVEGKTVNVDGQDFVIEDLIMSTMAIHGRGTTVYGVHPVPPTSSADPSSPYAQPKSSLRRSARLSNHHPPLPVEERLILKMSWQVTSRQSEDALLRLAEDKGVDGIIRLYKSEVVGRLSNSLRGKLVPKKMYVDRELRVQILGPRCIPLKRVGNIDDFKEAFRSLVRG